MESLELKVTNCKYHGQGAVWERFIKAPSGWYEAKIVKEVPPLNGCKYGLYLFGGDNRRLGLLPDLDDETAAHLSKNYYRVYINSTIKDGYFKENDEVDITIKYLKEKYIVYTYYDSEMNTLYVGKTVDFKNRNAQHVYRDPWWKDVAYIGTREYSSPVDMDLAEIYYINSKDTQYNKASRYESDAQRRCMFMDPTNENIFEIRGLELMPYKISLRWEREQMLTEDWKEFRDIKGIEGPADDDLIFEFINLEYSYGMDEIEPSAIEQYIKQYDSFLRETETDIDKVKENMAAYEEANPKRFKREQEQDI